MIYMIVGFYFGIAACLLKDAVQDMISGSRYIRRKRELEAAIAERSENIRLFGTYMSAGDAEKEKSELERLRTELEKLEKE